MQRVPPPRGDASAPLQALVFDSHYDQYKGVVAYVRVANGTLHDHERIRFMATGVESEILELGYFRPQPVPTRSLTAGEVGYVASGLKSIAEARVGDTLTDADKPAPEPLPGYQQALPLVFAGIYPMRGDDYPLLREALDKLHLNDASFVYEPESSVALGFGYRCGFLGLLHMEIVQERLEREFDLDLLASAPSVEYRVRLHHRRRRAGGRQPGQDARCRARSRRSASPGWQPRSSRRPTTSGRSWSWSPPGADSSATMEYLDPKRVNMHFELPLAELIIDFYDLLKSRTSGYASLDYQYIGYREGDLVKLDVLVNAEPVDALSLIVHRSNAYRQGKALVEKLKELIPRQMFEVPVQAAIGSHIISRETIRAMRKNVLAKCYGGDITRKRKLLEKQKEGKQRMKRIGSVEIPQEAFLAVLRMNEA